MLTKSEILALQFCMGNL